MKKPDGVIVIAIYYLVLALVFLIGSCAVLLTLVTAVTSTYDRVGAMWAAFGIGIGLLFCLILLVGSVMAGWGLLTLKNWGRWSAIILGAMQLLGFPIFTVIGGFIIYYLLREDVAAAFNGEPASKLAADVEEVVAEVEEATEDAAE